MDGDIVAGVHSGCTIHMLAFATFSVTLVDNRFHLYTLVESVTKLVDLASQCHPCIHEPTITHPLDTASEEIFAHEIGRLLSFHNATNQK